MASGGPEGPGGGGAGRGRGRPRKDLDPDLAPEVARWAGHLRDLIDACFATDAEAARALQVTSVTLSYYLAGKKEVPVRAFVRQLHTVLAQRHERPVDTEALEQTDQLYLAALAVLQPKVLELHILTDQRDAALRRENAARSALRRARSSLEFAEQDIAALRRDLRRARKEREAFASQTEDLLKQLRQIREEAAEAVVAEAIRIAEEAAVVQSARDEAARKSSKIIMVACSAASVASATVAALGPLLLGDGAPWQAWGWTAFGGTVLAATAAGTWRYRLLRRLGVYWDWRVHLLLIAICIATPAGSAFILAAAFTKHQDYLAHQVRVSAAVSDCEKDGRILVDAGGQGRPKVYAPSYACVYEWTVNDRTYRQRTDGLKEWDGAPRTVFVDPTHPDTMVPEAMARYWDLYAAAALFFACLHLPGWLLKEMQEKVAHRVRDRADQVLARAKETASAGAS